MNTSAWSPPSWRSLFFIAAGYDVNETDKKIKDPKYKNYFRSIGDVLPCRYCRESYEKFFDSMDIQAYMDMPSCGLIRFVYDMKNLVNAKLVGQERKLLDEEYAKILDGKSPNDPEVIRAMQEAKTRICYTKAAPPFEDVVAELLQHRAGCSPVLKTCRAPLKGSTGSSGQFNFPSPPQMPTLAINQHPDSVLYRKPASAAGGGRRVRSRSTTRRRTSVSRSRSRGKRTSRNSRNSSRQRYRRRVY